MSNLRQLILLAETEKEERAQIEREKKEQEILGFESKAREGLHKTLMLLTAGVYPVPGVTAREYENTCFGGLERGIQEQIIALARAGRTWLEIRVLVSKQYGFSPNQFFQEDLKGKIRERMEVVLGEELAPQIRLEMVFKDLSFITTQGGGAAGFDKVVEVKFSW